MCIIMQWSQRSLRNKQNSGFNTLGIPHQESVLLGVNDIQIHSFQEMYRFSKLSQTPRHVLSGESVITKVNRKTYIER